jgi:hypothetical protein
MMQPKKKKQYVITAIFEMYGKKYDKELNGVDSIPEAEKQLKEMCDTVHIHYLERIPLHLVTKDSQRT